MKPHKWAKEIKAWADGAAIESKDIATGEWEEVDPYWETDDEYEYRIKPQPKEPQYLYVYRTGSDIHLGTAPHPAMNMYGTEIVGKIKLEVDDGHNDQ